MNAPTRGARRRDEKMNASTRVARRLGGNEK
jgi:hypothetical protein